jgi:methenyltetrahydromethanopterin cyclohydrolase
MAKFISRKMDQTPTYEREALPAPMGRVIMTRFQGHSMGLNENGYAIAEELVRRCAQFGAHIVEAGGVRLVDCGVKAAGSDEAGLIMARVAMGGAGDVSVRGPDGSSPAPSPTAWPGCPWPTVTVSSEQPVAACLAAQYAGWKVASEKYFAMASGPIRAAIGREHLFDTIGMRERPDVAVGLLEASRLPPEAICHELAAAAGVTPENLLLLVARTASAAGTLQVVARSLETALHKLHDLGFNLARIRRGTGTAPLPPVPKDDLTAIGCTNDAILYGGSVVIEVTGDDASLAAIGNRAVSRGSPAFGKPFLAIFEAAGHDFYAIDPALFAPARLELVNAETGQRHVCGEVEPEIVASSFATASTATAVTQ